MEITPEIRADLKRVVWDYDLDESLLVDIFLGKKKTFSLSRSKLCSRLLISTPWYRLLDHFGISGLKEMLEPETLQWIWIQDLREKFTYAREALEQAA